MKENFDEALAAVLVHEGGYVDHPDDPGGATNKGITWRTYNAYRRRNNRPERDVREITDAEVAAIYRQQYWNAIKGDSLPSGLDYAVFDFAVNSGPSRAAKFLQRIVNVPADGIIGHQTLSAVDDMRSAKGLVGHLCDDRLAWLKRLRHWPTFGRGWSRRVAEVRAKGTRLAEMDYTFITGAEASAPANGKASGEERLTAYAADMMKDPRSLMTAGAVALPGLSSAAQGEGPVQWGIGIGLATLAIGLVAWLIIRQMKKAEG